jgi:hypothetical protein
MNNLQWFQTQGPSPMANMFVSSDADKLKLVQPKNRGMADQVRLEILDMLTEL